MATDQPVTLGEVYRLLRDTQEEVKSIRATYPSQRALNDRLEIVDNKIADARDDISRVEEQILAVRGEATQRRLLLYGAVVTAAVSLVASLILGGALTVGGG